MVYYSYLSFFIFCISAPSPVVFLPRFWPPLSALPSASWIGCELTTTTTTGGCCELLQEQIWRPVLLLLLLLFGHFKKRAVHKSAFLHLLEQFLACFGVSGWTFCHLAGSVDCYFSSWEVENCPFWFNKRQKKRVCPRVAGIPCGPSIFIPSTPPNVLIWYHCTKLPVEKSFFITFSYNITPITLLLNTCKTKIKSAFERLHTVRKVRFMIKCDETWMEILFYTWSNFIIEFPAQIIWRLV